jgi:hypothetical protein
MDFSRMSDGIRLHHASHHHDGYDDDEPDLASNGSWSHVVTEAGVHGATTSGHSLLASPGAAAADGALLHQSDLNHFVTPSLGSSYPGIGGVIESGASSAGNGGDGYFAGDIIHASLLVYEPINITVALGYGSVALASQINDVSVDQSALQMAGVGGNGGNFNMASGGNIATSAGSDMMIATGSNSAGNGGSGYFSGALVDAPVVIYHPINIALAASGGTAHASQSNTVEIDQSAMQIAGVGGQGGNGNVAEGGSVVTLDPAWGSGNGAGVTEVQTGGNQAGNGGDGSFSGELVHKSFTLYDPVNIAVAGFDTSSHAVQLNNVQVDQSALQIAGIGASGGNGNVAIGGSVVSQGALSHALSGGSDAIQTGSNGAGNGGDGHFSGSLIDVSIAIYAPINIAIAGPHATAEADQINNVHIDQSAIQIAGVGGDGGSGNLALGGAVALHLPSDLHLTG